MHIDSLTKATALRDELKLWQEARARCNPGVFKQATLRVADAAHGHQGQIAETTIPLSNTELIGFVEEQIARLTSELRGLGVDL